RGDAGGERTARCPAVRAAALRAGWSALLPGAEPGPAAGTHGWRPGRPLPGPGRGPGGSSGAGTAPTGPVRSIAAVRNPAAGGQRPRPGLRNSLWWLREPGGAKCRSGPGPAGGHAGTRRAAGAGGAPGDASRPAGLAGRYLLPE